MESFDPQGAIGAEETSPGQTTDQLFGIENLNGTRYGDSLKGDERANRLEGGEGDDVLEGRAGDDTLVGGGGNDQAIFSGPRAAYSVTRAGDVLTVRGAEGTDTVSGVEQFSFGGQTFTTATVLDVPTQGDDRLTGTEQDDVIDGLGGNDIINGLGGADTLIGGAGDDTITGGFGDDVVTGGAGRDVFNYRGGDGADRVNLGVETAATANSADFDQVNLSNYDSGLVFVSSEVGDGSAERGGQPGRLAVSLGTNEAMLDGGFDDEGVTFSSIEVLRVLDEERFAFGNRVTLGTQGADVIDYSGDAAALVYVNGGAGNDVITGPSGEGGFEFVRNTLIGGAGDDVLSSGGGQTTFDGGAGNDTINGGARDDVVDQYDLLNDGADTVNLGGGLDLVTLDSRSSDFNVVRLTINFAEVGNGSAFDSVAGGLNVRATLVGDPSGTTWRFDDEGISFFNTGALRPIELQDTSGAVLGAFEEVTLGTSGQDFLRSRTPADAYLNGGDGDDTLSGGFSNDLLVGAAGADAIFGDEGDDRVEGLDLAVSGEDRVDLGEGADRVSFAGAAGQIRLTISNGIVGDGNTNVFFGDGDGVMDVQAQAEDAAGDPTGRGVIFDDEGITCTAGVGQTFDVRNLNGVRFGEDVG